MRPLALAFALCACVPDNGPLMKPGEDCLACHGDDGNALPVGERRRHATDWTVAGTVFDAAGGGAEGADVEITDAAGFAFSLRANLAGNFYSKESVVFPLQACISNGGARVCQQSPVVSGACNSCHGLAELNPPQPPLAAP